VGAGGSSQFGPFSFTRRAQDGEDVEENLDPPPSPDEPTAVDGAFRAITVRNTELTGPYFHNGGFATLEQVVDFYMGGAHFFNENFDDLDPDVDGFGHGENRVNKDLVAFLKTLTDERVRWQRAPFDHPQLFVPDGHPGDENGVTDDGSGDGKATDQLREIIAVGANGAALPLTPFIDKLAPALTVGAGGNGVVVHEDGLAVTFTVALARPAGEPVTFNLSVTDPSEVAIMPTTLTFTPEDWHARQTITVMPIDDGVIDGDVLLAINSGFAQSMDPEWAEVAPTYIPVTSIDSGRARHSVTIQAEDGALAGPWQLVHDANTSGGAYVAVPEGAGFQDRPAAGGLEIELDIPADAAGNFRIWALEMAPNAGSDELYVRIDDGPWMTWNLARMQPAWVWDRINDSSMAFEADLAAGHHVLRIEHREDGAGIDKLVITNDMNRVPGGSDTGVRPSTTSPGDATRPLR
jgi:hypothetical protein